MAWFKNHTPRVAIPEDELQLTRYAERAMGLGKDPTGLSLEELRALVNKKPVAEVAPEPEVVLSPSQLALELWETEMGDWPAFRMLEQGVGLETIGPRKARIQATIDAWTKRVVSDEVVKITPPEQVVHYADEYIPSEQVEDDSGSEMADEWHLAMEDAEETEVMTDRVEWVNESGEVVLTEDLVVAPPEMIATRKLCVNCDTEITGEPNYCPACLELRDRVGDGIRINSWGKLFTDEEWFKMHPDQAVEAAKETVEMEAVVAVREVVAGFVVEKSSGDAEYLDLEMQPKADIAEVIADDVEEVQQERTLFEMTKDELYQRAVAANVAGRSKMTKSELMLALLQAEKVIDLEIAAGECSTECYACAQTGECSLPEAIAFRSSFEEPEEAIVEVIKVTAAEEIAGIEHCSLEQVNHAWWTPAALAARFNNVKDPSEQAAVDRVVVPSTENTRFAFFNPTLGLKQLLKSFDPAKWDGSGWFATLVSINPDTGRVDGPVPELPTV